jgi:threonine/homoserine/homoserine lactone efflux protein
VVSASHLLGFALTSFLLIIVPGPSVLFVVGRALAFGRRPAVVTAVGNAAGVYAQVVVIALGLGPVLQHSIVAFEVVKLGGAAYLVVLGVQAIRSSHRLAELAGDPPSPRPTGRALGEGFIVGVTNPKATILFAAIAPQFVDPANGPVALQLLLLGLVAMTIAVVCDSAWALASGTARQWLTSSPRRIAAVGGAGGLVMIGLGLRLAFVGRRD